MRKEKRGRTDEVMVRKGVNEVESGERRRTQETRIQSD